MVQVSTSYMRIQLASQDQIGQYRIGETVVMAGVRNIPRAQRSQRMYVAAIDEENGVITLTHEAPRVLEGRC